MKSYEERKAIIHEILFGQPLMLWTKPMKKGTLRNRCFGKSCTGFSIDIDNLSYRGIWVSTIENLKLFVDGEEVPEDCMMIELNGVKYPVHTLVDHTEIFWAVNDPCTLHVNKIGGLAKGEHKLRLEVYKRLDFGHSLGNGEEGYQDATEFHTPELLWDEDVYEI